MEPPRIAELFICLVSSVGLFVLASYEATFAVLSRSALERMYENGVTRADRMLKIHEPRHRLHLMHRTGQSLGAIAVTLSVYFLVRAYLASTFYAILVTAAVAALLLLVTNLARRTRFEAEGEESRIPAFTLAYVPIHALLLPVTSLLERIALGESSEEDFKAAKEEELLSIVEAEQETGVLEEGERDMIHGVFGFHDRVAREVMVPRVDVAAIDQTATIDDLLRLLKETGHSRVPLYEESLDRILGIVYMKDLLHILVSSREFDLSQSLGDLIASQKTEVDGTANTFLREPYYVPETKKVDELLRDLRAARTRLAVVVDEYGGTAGLVTTEDLVEEIVGEIQDEHDAVEELFQWRKPGEILIVNPRINIDELNDLLETELPSNGYDTLGGYIYDQIGHIPQAGQSLEVPGLEIEILRVDGQRIGLVQMTLTGNGNGNSARPSKADSESSQ